MKKRIVMTLIMIGTMCLMMTGCSSRKKEEKKLNCKSIEIQYIGNSSFLFTLDNGTTIVADPYTSNFNTTFGTFPDLKPNIVTTTHDAHPDHTGWDQLKNGVKYIRHNDMKKKTSYSLLKDKAWLVMPDCQGKTLNIGGVNITEYKTKHVSYPDINHSVVIYQIGDYKIAHMGEADTIEKGSKVYKAMQNADVLLYYAGAYDKKTNTDMYKLGQELNVKVMIPQHFSDNDEHVFYGEPTATGIEKELSSLTKVTTADKFDLTKENIKDAKQKVLILNHISTFE